MSQRVLQFENEDRSHASTCAETVNPKPHKLEAIALRVEAIASRLEAIASRLEAISWKMPRVKDLRKTTAESPDAAKDLSRSAWRDPLPASQRHPDKLSKNQGTR